jgi:hypothetical protein
VLAGPVDVLHRLTDVVERDEGLAGPTARSLRAEVGQPTVVGHPGLTFELGTREGAGVVRRRHLEGPSVGEEHLGDDALGLHVLQAEIRVPLRGDVEPRLDAARLPRSPRLLVPEPLVEDVEMLLVDIVPVGAA